MGFAVWLMWSVTATRIQIAHDNDPTVYHFKDFAPEIMGVSDGFRGCPGWYEHSCCSTWLDAPQADFDAWQASAQGQAVLGDVTYANADLFMKSAHFKPMMYNTNETAGSPDGFTPFLNGGGQAFGCPVDTERKLSYRELLFVVPSAAGLAGGVFRLPNSFMTPIVGGLLLVHLRQLLVLLPPRRREAVLSDAVSSTRRETAPLTARFDLRRACSADTHRCMRERGMREGGGRG